ncbi:SDR family oxidoreductase [bacterium]|nr:SDR family oxidoreductase [bacterium]
MIKGKTIVIIGGSSGIGLASAQLLAIEGARVIIGSRTHKKIESALKQIETTATGYTIDMTLDESVSAFFSKATAIDHLIITAAGAELGNFLELDINKAQSFFESKFWGPYRVAKKAAPLLARGGSITFFSGAAGRRASPGFACGSAINAAVETLAQTLALELAPIRVNTISPGIIDTPVWDSITPDKNQLFSEMAVKFPGKRIGQPADIAHAVRFVIENPFITGTTLFVDGGYLLTN